MEEKIIVITGASDGIGAAARELHRRGATVVIIGRSPQKTQRIAEELHAKYYIADFAKLDDVRTLAHHLKRDYPHIDVLINNAGGIFGPRELTIDGHEKTMQVNHYAHFLLTTLLLDTLIASKATIINTSSIGNKWLSDFDINDIELGRGYTQHKAYGNAKLANILFTKELHRRYHKQGISAVAVHPGNIASNFADDSNSPMRFIYKTPLARLLDTPEKGAEPLVWLASSIPGVDWKPGEYYEKRKLAKAKRQAYDPGLAKTLWEKSEAFTQ